MNFDPFPKPIQNDEEFRLTAPEGEDHDEDSLGELSTNDGIVIDDSRDDYYDTEGTEYDDPVDHYGEQTYEDYEPNPYDGTYSEM